MRRDRLLRMRLRPRNEDQLHAWLRLAVDIEIPRAAMLEGNSAPFDYLSHAFFEDRAPRDCVVWANRGGGKTFLGAVATMLDLVFKPGIEIRILGGSLEQSARMQRHLRRFFERPMLTGLLDGRLTDRRIRLQSGSMCETLAQSHTSVRGCRVQKLRCDEVELFDEDIWEAAQLVTRSATCGDVFVRGCVEAFSTMHQTRGLMAKLVDGRIPGDHNGAARRLFRWGVVDTLEHCETRRACEGCDLFEECAGRAKNATGFTPIEDAVSLKQRSSEAAWRSEMLCERPSRRDVVLPEFDPAVHVVTHNASEGGRWVAGMDFGFRAPTVVLWGMLDASEALHIMEERCERGVVLDEHIAAILEPHRPKPAWVGIDPAGRQRSDQTGISSATAMRRAGLAVRDRRHGVMEGVSMIRRRLAPAVGGPTLFIHARCRQLIESLQQYHFPSDRPDEATPIKDGSDHAVDALRYLIVNLDYPHRQSRRPYV